jgi:hypothetical protein
VPWRPALSTMRPVLGEVLAVGQDDTALRSGRRAVGYAEAMSRPARLLVVVAIVAAALAFIAWLAGRG